MKNFDSAFSFVATTYALLVCAGTSVLAQGQFIFDNHVPSEDINARFLLDGVDPLDASSSSVGGGWHLDLRGGPIGIPFGLAVPLQPPQIAFLSQSPATYGYVVPTVVTVPGLAAGQRADVYFGLGMNASGFDVTFGPVTVTEPEERLSLRTRFRSFFRNNLDADSISASNWVLVMRKDQGGLAERILPGEKLRFGATNLTCEAASGIALGERLWELPESTMSLCVYHIVSPQTYSGACFRVTQTGNELVLVPTLKLTRSANGQVTETYKLQAEATYQRER